jgi:3-oxoacyl-[acyl-carrier-protein] synthase-3
MHDQHIHIDGLAHRCGRWIDIGDTLWGAQQPSTVSYLRNLGVKRYSKLEDTLESLIKTVVPETLDRAQLSAADVGAVVFFSTTFDPYTQHSDFAQSLSALDLGNAIPYGVFHNQCTNHSQAIELATHLTRSLQKDVLVIGYDALDDARGDRCMPNNVSVYSDAICSFIVGTRAGTGFRVNGLKHRYRPELALLQTPANALQFLTAYAEAFKGTSDALYTDLNSNAAAFQLLVTANYNQSVVKNLAELAGFPLERLYTDNIGQYGHCFAMDHLIALEQLDRTASPGNSYLLAAVGGFVVFSAIAVTKL